MKYGILIYPHANIRYKESLKQLTLEEFKVIINRFSLPIEDIKFINFKGMELLSFKSEELNEKNINLISKLSSLLYLFKIDGELLDPIENSDKRYFYKDLPLILKYRGKTNEMFTSLMINLALFSSDFYRDYDKNLNVFDPMCGRGTTLFQSLVNGYNSYGIELRSAEVQEGINYFKRYLKYNKIKHKMVKTPISVAKERYGVRYHFETAPTKDLYKNGDVRKLELIVADSTNSSHFFSKNKFHMVVTDLPYGIQHNSLYTIDELILLQAEELIQLVKTGGSIVLSFNSNTIDKNLIETLIQDGGFSIVETGDRFKHWVEQAITRDIVIAIKK